MNSHDVPSTRCPFCAHEFTLATNATGTNSPDPGDATVCIECAHVLVFDADLRPRALTYADRQRLIAAGAWDDVIKARNAVAVVSAKRIAAAWRIAMHRN